MATSTSSVQNLNISSSGTLTSMYRYSATIIDARSLTLLFVVVSAQNLPQCFLSKNKVKHKIKVTLGDKEYSYVTRDPNSGKTPTWNEEFVM